MDRAPRQYRRRCGTTYFQGHLRRNSPPIRVAGEAGASSAGGTLLLRYSTVNGGAREIRPLAFSRVAIRPKMPARKNFITTMTSVAKSSMWA